jgi:hypothetical protein
LPLVDVVVYYSATGYAGAELVRERRDQHGYQQQCLTRGRPSCSPLSRQAASVGSRPAATATAGTRHRGPSPVGMTIRVWISDTRRVPDLMGTGMGMVFYPWVAPVSDPN